MYQQCKILAIKNLRTCKGEIWLGDSISMAGSLWSLNMTHASIKQLKTKETLALLYISEATKGKTRTFKKRRGNGNGMSSSSSQI